MSFRKRLSFKQYFIITVVLIHIGCIVFTALLYRMTNSGLSEGVVLSEIVDKDVLARSSLESDNRLLEGEHLSIPRKDLAKSDDNSNSINLSGINEDLKNGLSGVYDDTEYIKTLKEFTIAKPYEPDEITEYLVRLLERYVARHFDVDITKMINDFVTSGGQWPFKIKKGRPLPLIKRAKRGTNLPAWRRFHMEIQEFALYDPSTGVVDELLRDIANQDIIEADEKQGGTQLKVLATLRDGGIALLKPQRFGRTYEASDNHFYFSDFERHNAEIAAYHVDRVMGFYRSVPVAGRLVNITRDIRRLAHAPFNRTFFRSPAWNVCFHGTCKYYCDTAHAICGRPDIIEASMGAYLPSHETASIHTWLHPWRRAYNKHLKATWETQDDYCDDLKQAKYYNTGRRLLDMMDLSVYDFLIGNLDRHHYTTFKDFGNFTAFMNFDHGRSFGRAFDDEMSCLMPIIQCCLIRYSTLVKLLILYRSPLHLSDLMRTSLARDVLPPALTEAHLVALDRRVAKTLTTVVKCIQNGNKIRDVVEDDGF